MNKIKKVKIILSIIFVLLSLATMAAAVYFYQILMQTQANITEQQYRIDKTDEREQILANLSKKYTEIEDTTTIINTALPDKKDSSRLMSDLESLAVESGLKLKLLSTDTSTNKKTPGDPSLLQTVSGKYGYELPLNVSVEGSYANFLKFVKKVENYQRLINITSLDVSHPDQKTDLILAKLKLTAYIKKMNIKEELINIKEQNLKTSWLKAVFSTVLVSLVIYIGFAAYLFIKPISEDVKGIIDTEINASDIKFDKKTLDNLKKRQSPPDTTTPSTGKNPFLPF